VPRRTAAQAAETRAALIGAATERFARDGWDATSADQIATEAGVTRGALYHHFPAGKPDLLEAVHLDRLAVIDEALTIAGTEAIEATGDLWDGLIAGTARYLELCVDPTIARIVLSEAPKGLGWDRWEAIDEEFSVAQLAGILELLVADGQIPPQPLLPLARLLVALYNRAGRAVLTADDPEAEREVQLALLTTFLRSLGS
jgi:AcrR family transcriptional regulator